MALGQREYRILERLSPEKRFMFFMVYYGLHGSLGAIIVGTVLLAHPTASCAGFLFLGATLVLIGVALLILVYISFSLVHDHPYYFKIVALCLSIPLMVALLALGIFAVATSSRGGGKPLPGRSYDEYRLESYSDWMQKRVNDTRNWDVYYKKTVVKHHGCHQFSKEYGLDTLDEFHQRSLNPFESGCCKPPEDCNFNYTSPTVWVRPENGNYSNNDCNIWNNDPTILCYNCQSCKAAFAQDVKSTWFEAGMFIVVQGSLLLSSLCIMGSYLCTPTPSEEHQLRNRAPRRLPLLQ